MSEINQQLLKHTAQLSDSVTDLVKRYGATVVGVKNDAGEYIFFYTVGLAVYGHKDLIIYGASTPGLVRDIMVTVMTGSKYEANVEYNGLMHVYPIVFKDLLPDVGNEDCWQARKYYLNNDVEEVGYMQLVFPDKQGLWPWDDGCNEVVRNSQQCSFLPQ